MCVGALRPLPPSQTDDSAVQYGITSVLSNLTLYRRRTNEEEEQMKKLKEFAGEKQPKVRAQSYMRDGVSLPPHSLSRRPCSALPIAL
jgi:hypothetical protein